MNTDDDTPTTPRPLDVDIWVAYLRDLEELLKPQFTPERWALLFKRTDTPAQAADKLATYAPRGADA